jgi:hypothetical protein
MTAAAISRRHLANAATDDVSPGAYHEPSCCNGAVLRKDLADGGIIVGSLKVHDSIDVTRVENYDATGSVIREPGMSFTSRLSRARSRERR